MSRDYFYENLLLLIWTEAALLGHPPNEVIFSRSDWKTVDSKRVSLFWYKFILVSFLIDLIPAEINRLIAIVNCEFLEAIERQWEKIN